MADFYNPYNFVPVEKPTEAQKAAYLDYEAFEKGELPEARAHVTHSRYVPNTVSGRLVVRLQTVTSTVVGAQQDRSDRKSVSVVKPYTAGGQPAIPASSLRGLIGSVMEAVSNGPLRVLEPAAATHRLRRP